MVIEINGRQYINPDFKVDNGIATIKVLSDKTFSEIASDFVVSAGDSILQYDDNGNQIGELFVEGMASIQLPGEDGSEVVTVKYHVSQIGTDAQDALHEGVEDASDAILELCELIAEQTQTIEETCSRIEDSQSEQGHRLDSLSNTLNSNTESISRWETMYNTLADRVARLENGGN